MRARAGWRVPREGTVSHKIFELHLKGKPTEEIAETVGKTKNHVQVLIHRFKHPIQHNKWALSSYHRTKKNKLAS